MVEKIRPNATWYEYNGCDGRDSTSYIFSYTCPTCHKKIREGDIACEDCGTFFDWSKKAYVEIRKELVWR